MIPAIEIPRRLIVRTSAAIWRYFGDHASHEQSPRTKELFRIVLLAWFALNTLVLLPRHEEFWGPDAFVVRTFEPEMIHHWVLRIINHPALVGYHVVFVFVQLAAISLAIAGWRTRLMTGVAFLMTINLHHRCFVISDGGNNISWLLIMLLLAMNTGRNPRPANGARQHFSVALSNTAFWVARFQVIAMYATAGLCKASGAHWQNGTSLYYILQVENYANPTVAPLMVAAWPLTVIAAYLTVVFQLSFPFLVWTKRARWVLFAVGVLLHINIAVVMGLPGFGVVMCVTYLLFLHDHEAAAISSWFRPEPTTLVVHIDRASRAGRIAMALARLAERDRSIIVCDTPPGSNPIVVRDVERDSPLLNLGVLVSHTSLWWARPLLHLLYLFGADHLLLQRR